MKNDNNNRKFGTEDRLKQLSDGYEVPFNEAAWEKMENLLEPEEPNNDSPNFFTLKIVIAMILFLSILYFTFTTINQPEVSLIANAPIAEQSVQTTDKELNENTISSIDETPSTDSDPKIKSSAPQKPSGAQSVPNSLTQGYEIKPGIKITPPLIAGAPLG